MFAKVYLTFIDSRNTINKLTQRERERKIVKQSKTNEVRAKLGQIEGSEAKLGELKERKA